MLRHHLTVVVFACFVAVEAVSAHAARDANAWRLQAHLKARSLIIDPATAERSFVLDPLPDPLGIVSPDGRKVAYVGSDPARVSMGYDFDLFVADVDDTQPAGKANIRRLTTDQIRPRDVCWLKTSNGIAFVAQQSNGNTNDAVWFVDLSPDSKPVRLSDDRCERAWQLSITPGDHIAYTLLNGRKNKEQSSDLITRRPPNRPARASEGGGQKRLLSDQHISSYAFSPDGKTLAWSGLGSMFLTNLETNESREIPLHGIHPQLINHTAHNCAWRPDGKVIAIRCGFLGGIAREFNGDPNAPWPRMFAADKVFFVPVNWSPAPESLTVGEGDAYPSPTADDPDAEISPPAGDESKPWWVREVPEHVNALTWVSDEEAKRRIANHPAPPEVRPEPPPRRLPPPSGNEPRP